jgi:guanine nucleotide-binding protein subunit alpha
MFCIFYGFFRLLALATYTHEFKSFLNEIERVAQPAYIPTTEDLLRIRVRSCGSETVEFRGRDEAHYSMQEIGGSRSQRRKWTRNIKERPDVVIFMASLDFYDTKHADVSRIPKGCQRNDFKPRSEDTKKDVVNRDASQTYEGDNYIRESLLLFEAVTASPETGEIFKDAKFVVLLNKVLHFQEKMESGTAPLKIHFPDYKGDETDIFAAQEFFEDKFRGLFPSERGSLTVLCTNITDKGDVNDVMRAVSGVMDED